MSLFERIQKRILNEEDKRDSNRERYNQVEKERQEERRNERRREKKFSKNISNKVNINKNKNPSSRTSTPKRGSTTFVPGGQGTLPDFDPETGKTVTDKAGNPLFGKEPPKEKKVKTTYNKKTVTQTPIETSGPLFDQQPTKKGFKSFMKSPAYYAKQREKTKAGRNRYDFIPDKEGKFDFNPKTKKSNIEKYARRMLSRKQIDSKSNVPIKLTSDDLAKAERDARSKYGGRDGEQMTQNQRNKVIAKVKNQPKPKTMTYLSPAGSGKPVPLKTRRIIKKIKTFKTKMDLSKPIKDPWFTGKDDYPDGFDGNKPETKSQKVLNKVKDEIKKKKIKTPPKFVKPSTTGLYDPLKNKIPKLDPLKPLRIPKLKPSVVTKTATKTKLFPKVMKAVAKNPRTALAVGLLGLGTYGSIKNRIATNKLKKNKMLPPVSGGGNTVTTKPRDIELFLRTDSSRK